jgi:transposase
MSFRLRPGHRIYIFSEYVDMRAGFNRLSMIVRERIKAKMVDGDLFLFLGKNRKKLKGLCYDGTGLLLISKHLEQGSFMRLDRLESLEITNDELDDLLRGSVIKRTHFGDEALTRVNDSTIVVRDGSGNSRNEHRGSQGICHST